MHQELARWLAERLEQPLPDCEARARFAPALSYGRHFGPASYDARPAAVMILLYPHEGQWLLPLTVRPETMLAHAGQISLPGGVVEPGETTRDAALRELEEELGIPANLVEVVGELSPLNVFVSNFMVVPWVAVVAQRPTIRANPHEVAEVLEVPLACLLDTTNQGTRSFRRGELTFTVPYFRWGEHHIWGATSMILAELNAILSGAPVGG